VATNARSHKTRYMYAVQQKGGIVRSTFECEKQRKRNKTQPTGR